jgi:hypothetical protein
MTIAGKEQTGQILSQDALGRVLIMPERRDMLLAEFDRSGMSGIRFGQYVGIKYTTLACWLTRRRRQRQERKVVDESRGWTKNQVRATRAGLKRSLTRTVHKLARS